VAVSLVVAGAAVAIPATAAQASPPVPTWNTEIRNHASDGCVDQSWAGGTENADVNVWTCLDQSNQRWKLMPVGSPTNNYMIKNERSGKCLNQDYSGGKRHANVIAYTCSTSMPNGIWRMLYVPLNGEDLYAFYNLRSGDILNQDYHSNTAHPDLLAWPDPGYLETNELWYFHLE
jgi:hypothetical protein